MPVERIAHEDFTSTFSATTELSSVAIGGKIISVSDEFFAEARNLLLVEPAVSMKGQFGPKGALFSGWESRRHNPTYDWCILKLGTPGSILGFDVDTAHFNGNEAPQVSIDALYLPPGAEDPKVDDANWAELLERSDCGPSSRHLFKIPETKSVNYIKLNMYPDGGIARFRVYGLVTPVYPTGFAESFDLAHVFSGGHVEATSDQHFGVGTNLILPGRGKDMGDGWETKRSRGKGHNDWVIIRLGAPGYLQQAEIDTAHFMGNFPESCELHAGFSASQDQEWTPILARVKLGPHRQHFFQLENVEAKAFTHVRLTIHPDGGVKRVRIIGTRAPSQHNPALSAKDTSAQAIESTAGAQTATMRTTGGTVIPAVPLTPEAFAPFGKVVQAYADINAAPRGTKITPANAGSAIKFHKLAPILSSYPSGSDETAALAVYRCQPVIPTDVEGLVDISVLERHPYTNQAFVPMGSGPYDGLEKPSDRYLVAVAKNKEDGGPDLKTLRAFVASAAQAIVYDTAVWHMPMTVLGKALDFTCVETQIGNGDKADCEIVQVEGAYQIRVPAL